MFHFATVNADGVPCLPVSTVVRGDRIERPRTHAEAVAFLALRRNAALELAGHYADMAAHFLAVGAGEAVTEMLALSRRYLAESA